MTTAKLAGFITLLLVLCASSESSYSVSSRRILLTSPLTRALFFSPSVNFFGVRWFGESEFCFAVIKIALM